MESKIQTSDILADPSLSFALARSRTHTLTHTFRTRTYDFWKATDVRSPRQ